MWRRGRRGSLVEETLLGAIRTDSVKALVQRFEVGHRCVGCRRRAFGVSRVGTEGAHDW